MAVLIEGDDLDSLYRDVLVEVGRRYDIETSPRGMRTRELFAATLVLKDPRRRIICSTGRAVNYSFAAAEFLWYWQGRDDLAYLLPYNSRLAEFSNDGKTVGSAYGARIFGGMSSQWKKVADELVADKDSRRAVLRIFDPKDLRPDNKDVPCTLGIQFLLRDRRLHAHVTMRSNDVFWGLPYDVFSFTLLQEAMMLTLREHGVCDGLGHYTHTAGSLHVYERHFEKLEQILSEEPFVADPMGPLSSLGALWTLCNLEDCHRHGRQYEPRHEPREGTAEHFLNEQIRYKWRGGFRRPLAPARPSVARFERLIACEDSDP